MARLIIILDNGGGPLDRAEVSYNENDADPGERLDEAVKRVIEGWTLSAGDTIKIREPGREDT